MSPTLCQCQAAIPHILKGGRPVVSGQWPALLLLHLACQHQHLARDMRGRGVVSLYCGCLLSLIPHWGQSGHGLHHVHHAKQELFFQLESNQEVGAQKDLPPLIVDQFWSFLRSGLPYRGARGSPRAGIGHCPTPWRGGRPRTHAYS